MSETGAQYDGESSTLAADRYVRLRSASAELTAPGAPFEMTPVRVRGLTLREYRNAPPTVRDLWLDTARYGDSPYLVYDDERISYARAHQIVASLAGWLVANGIRPGDRVAIAMRNYPEWMLAYWASICVGAAVVGINAWWTAEEIGYAFKDATPKIAFVDAERLERVQASPATCDVRLVTVRTPAAGDAIAWESVISGDERMPDVSIDPDDDACILYTSGTTGFPKGARLTHRGCVGSLWNVAFAVQAQAMASAEAGATAASASPFVSLICTPLFHVTANNCVAYLTTTSGGTIVLMYRWDAGRALELIEREGVTLINGVPVMARELIDHPDFSRRNVTSLARLGGAGAQLQAELVAGIDETAPGRQPTTGYGLTEACGTVTSSSGLFLTGKPNSVGAPAPLFDVRIVDDQGRDVPSDGIGELWLRSSTIIKGYLNKPDETAEAITDGWLHTGDIARRDPDGFLYIVDRKKEMVLRGGENVYCAEVEACLYRHPAVLECCVFGIPDRRLGEDVAAAVVTRSGSVTSSEELRQFCRSQIAAFKVPREIQLSTAQLPRMATGKFDKKRVRAGLLASLGEPNGSDRIGTVAG